MPNRIDSAFRCQMTHAKILSAAKVLLIFNTCERLKRNREERFEICEFTEK